MVLRYGDSIKLIQGSGEVLVKTVCRFAGEALRPRAPDWSLLHCKSRCPARAAAKGAAPSALPAQGFAPGNPDSMHSHEQCQARMLPLCQAKDTDDHAKALGSRSSRTRACADASILRGHSLQGVRGRATHPTGSARGSATSHESTWRVGVRGAAPPRMIVYTLRAGSARGGATRNYDSSEQIKSSSCPKNDKKVPAAFFIMQPGSSYSVE
jgi:hypothetical protein